MEINKILIDNDILKKIVVLSRLTSDKNLTDEHAWNLLMSWGKKYKFDIFLNKLNEDQLKRFNEDIKDLFVNINEQDSFFNLSILADIADKYNEEMNLIAINKAKKVLKPLSFQEFMAIEDKKEYYIKNMFAKGTINMIFSPPAQMKTFLSYYIAICMATGNHMLNQKTKKVNVCYFDWENPFSDVQNRVKGICTGLNINTSIIDSLFFFPKQPSLLKSEKFDNWIYDDLRNQLINFIKDNNIKVIFFDTLRRLGNFDENDSNAINTIKSELFDKLIEETEVCIIFLHHTSKAGIAYRGSVDIEGILDTAFKCEKKIRDDTIYLNIVNTKRRNNEIEEINSIVDIINYEKEIDGEMLEFIDNVKFTKVDTIEQDNKSDYSLYRSYFIENLEVGKHYKNKSLQDLLMQEFHINSPTTTNKIIKWLVDIKVILSIGSGKSKYYSLNPSNMTKEQEILYEDMKNHLKSLFKNNNSISIETIKNNFDQEIYAIVINDLVNKGLINMAKKGYITLTELGVEEFQDYTDNIEEIEIKEEMFEK